MRYLRLDERLQLDGDTLLAMYAHAVTAIAQPAALLHRRSLRDAIVDRAVRDRNESDASRSLSSVDSARGWLPERLRAKCRKSLTSPRDAVCEILR
jgi:hypothetical protein